MGELFDNTICAPATSVGGAIAVVRVSGRRALEIASGIFKPASGRTPLSAAEGYTMHFGTVVDGQDVVDEVLASVFRAPHSYTGENSVEISCHASPFIVQKILDLLVAGGCKMAAPGEFTQRAFVNGKMDLSQAEAVADVIAAQTAAAHRIALNQLKGGFSDELADMRAQLLKIVSLMELELDFSEEEVEFADRSELKTLLDKVIAHIERLVGSFRLGNAIKNGVPVAIVGAVNSGKSTLLNAILGENRAIVSDIAGTTRDTIEETFNIDGILFRFIDTAGLRKSSDTIEQIGIERSYETLSRAAAVLCVLDISAPSESILSIAADIKAKLTEEQKLIFVLNKADLASIDALTEVRKALVQEGSNAPVQGVSNEHMPDGCNAPAQEGSNANCAGAAVYAISAKSKIGLSDLLKHLGDSFKSLNSSSETTLVSNLRHKEALDAALTALRRTRSGLDTCTPTDLIAQDIREALYHLASIVGEISTDEILGNIFKNFCIGK